MYNWLVLLATAVATVSAATDKFVCYYGSWAVYRPLNGKFTIDNINPNLCTHIIYSFIGINDDGTIRILDAANDIGGFAKLNQLKTRNRNLKTLVAIGGWNAGSTSFSKVVTNPATRAKFVDESVKFLQKYGFNGLDLDWEYPAQRGGAPTDKSNFSKLLAELRKAFTPRKFLLTAAVAAGASSVSQSYEVPQLSTYLDFINVMTYDFHSSADGKTGQNAPLYASSIDKTPAEKQKNVDASIKDWIKRGARPDKLILGVGIYGRSFTLTSAANNKLGAPTKGAGQPGPYTREAGMLGYNEICENIKSRKWKEVWDDQQKVPYAYNGDQWVGYDNARSVEVKVKYAKSNKLGGVMVWSIDTDDFKGACGPPYPILNTIKKNLGGGIAPRSFFPEEFECIVEGYTRDPYDCNKIYHCYPVNGKFDLSVLRCPRGLYFDPNDLECRRPDTVVC